MQNLRHHVIFIEGLPGSGKTTFAKRLAEHYRDLGLDVVQLNEGDLHPIDLCWCAYCNTKQYNNLLNKYPQFKDEIKKYTQIEDEHHIIAYTKIKHPSIDKRFFDDMEKLEVYRYSSREKFLNVHKNKWKRFNQHFDPEKLYIFECVFIQNHINELILNDHANHDDIIQYFQELISTIKDTNPIVFHIEQMEIKQTLNKIIEERRSNDPSKYRDWIENVERYMEKTNHAKALGYLSVDGFYRYEKYRQDLTKEILEKIDVNHHHFHLNDDYDAVFEQMKKTSIIEDVH